jgi:hypothetical protein
MGNVKLSDVSAGARLLKKVVEKADINQDGAVRSTDLEKIRKHLQNPSNSRGNWWTGDSQESRLYYAIRGAAEYATRVVGGRTVDDVKAAVEDLKARARSADADGDGKLAAGEQSKLRTQGEKSFLEFVIAYKGKKISDIDLPDQHEAPAPTFNWSGTPAKVAQSLLDACTKRANDNFWPSSAQPSRYNITVAEARDMVEALRPLYKSRQKSVLTELCNRSQASEFGCVAPSDAARRVLEEYAAGLGLTLSFGQPAAPGFET